MQLICPENHTQYTAKQHFDPGKSVPSVCLGSSSRLALPDPWHMVSVASLLHYLLPADLATLMFRFSLMAATLTNTSPWLPISYVVTNYNF